MAEEKKRVRPTWKQVRELESELRSVKDMYATLEKSNDVLQSKVSFLDELADNLANEVERLKGRGFWARVFNK